jgi:hypothetical protein
MITPALLILGSASLIATALVRLARVVDRSRVLIGTIDSQPAAQTQAIGAALDRHERRAILAERSVALFFAAVIVFVLACLSIGADTLAHGTLAPLPIGLTILGMFVLIGGAAVMVAESSLGTAQIREEIRAGRERLRGRAGPA